MLPKTLIKGFDKRRLRNLLGIFFLALAIPTVVLIWQAYSQLKWEAFHQYRGVAEELTRRIDDRLSDVITTADARSFADYAFLVIAGDPSANFVQRSPLAAYPVVKEVPGVIGYFQVDTNGTFSTPLLPATGSDPQQLGIANDEYTGRLQLAREIQSILADNRLVRSRSDAGLLRSVASLPMPPAAAKAAFEEEKTSEPEVAQDDAASMNELLEQIARGQARSSQEAKDRNDAPAREIGGFTNQNQQAADKDTVMMAEVAPVERAASGDGLYSQQVFDRLNAGIAGMAEADDEGSGTTAAKSRLNSLGKVADLKLDAGLQKKSENIERAKAKEQRSDPSLADAPGRSRTRKEKITLPEASVVAAPVGGDRAASFATSGDIRISTFESEIDPLEFSLLDSGHFVLFRKVWRNGERYIQGLLIDQNSLVTDVISSRFTETALSSMSNLIVAHQDDVIRTINGRDAYSGGYVSATNATQGTLLYKSRLSAPLESLELIYTINRLPPGPGASVLVWVTIILALVFPGGFYTLHRLGLSQINLARQQQDFVSAVSHELKTPLTSIRMYGEMLKEGWADEEKRQSYYEYIHDESERLGRLISNVLQLAKITRNERQFDSRLVSVGELMSNVESKISSQVERAGFTLNFQRDEQSDEASIDIDADCFAQIIINLVDNAIKFSKNAEQKRIEISSKLASDNTVEFSVRDFGPGIHKDQMKKIFTLFYRSESELTRETVGTGIGLAIVHQLTVAMNGKVDVINRDPGAEFRLLFSKKLPA